MTKQNQNRSDSEINAAITLFEQASSLLARGRNEQALDLFLQLIDQASWLIPSYSGAGAASLEIGRFQQALDLVTEGLRVVEARPPDSNKDLEQELTRQRSLLVSQKASALSG
jgi:tetratricopeptide (TPR) repeat protein